MQEIDRRTVLKRISVALTAAESSSLVGRDAATDRAVRGVQDIHFSNAGFEDTRRTEKWMSGDGAVHKK